MKLGIACVSAVALLSVACASSSGPKPPSWLEKNAKQMVKSLGDSKANISYVLGRFPIVIVQGELTCGQCSRPFGVPQQTGSIAAGRYDGRTHQGTDFTIGSGTVRRVVAGVCSTHGGACASGGSPDERAVRRRVLYEGVSSGIVRRVVHYSDAESLNRAGVALASWHTAIRTRAARWPQYHWDNPGVAGTERALARYARRYGFRVTRLVWQTPKQLAPEIVIRTTHYTEVGNGTAAMLERLMTGFEGYYFEADDERGVPFLYISKFRRGPSGGGKYWARSDAVSPFIHG